MALKGYGGASLKQMIEQAENTKIELESKLLMNLQHLWIIPFKSYDPLYISKQFGKLDRVQPVTQLSIPVLEVQIRSYLI